MAFTPDTLSVIVQPIGGVGVRFLSYLTDDDTETVIGSGYFASATKFGVRQSDLIFVTPAVGGTEEPYVLVVDSIDNDGNGTGVINRDDAAPFPTVSVAENTNIRPTIHAIEVYGNATVGDGLAGIYTDTNNGATETFVSGDGRTWYLAGDFLQSGTGAVSRPTRYKNRDIINVLDFGTPTGGDNSAIINAAIDEAAARGGGNVVLPPGTTPATEIILKANVNLVPAGRGSTLQNIGSATYFLRAEGSVGANVSLTANASAGATQITISSTAGIAADDYLVLSDNYSYAATDATYKSGEMVQVKSVDSGTQLTLVGELYGSNAPGNAYTTANSAKIQRVSPIIAPKIEDVEFFGDKVQTTVAIHAMYALRAKFSPRVRTYGNTALLLRGCIDSEAVGGLYDDLLDDIAGGHAGYGICAAGPNSAVRVQGNTMARCRHGFTTIGGSTGYSHDLIVSGNQTHDTSQAGIDTHASGDDILIAGNKVSKSAGAGISLRSRGTRVLGNDISRTTIHGILLAEDNLSDVTIANNTIDAADGHGISSSPSCRNLKIRDNQLTNIGLDGITLFGSGTIDSTGLVVRDNDIFGYGLAASNRAGIITTGSVGSTGAIISGNTVAPLTGSSNYGIRTLQLTGSAVIDNKFFGTFATSSVDAGSNVSLGNKRIDNAVPQIQLDPVAAAIRTIGPNTNEDLLIIPKGTGVVRFGTFTSNADAAVNGYVTIKSIDGTSRKLATIA